MMPIEAMCEQTKENLYQTEMPNSYYGNITAKIIDTTNRLLPTFILNDHDKYRCYNDTEFNIAKVGDMLVKPPGTLKQILLRKNDTLYFSPICNGQEIKDK